MNTTTMNTAKRVITTNTTTMKPINPRTVHTKKAENNDDDDDDGDEDK